MSRYREYLGSEAWQVRRQMMLAFADHRCQVCNSTRNLQVHHRTYDRLGEEIPSDLTVLCDDCHAHHHRKLSAVPAPPARTILDDQDIAFPTAAEAAQTRKDAEALSTEAYLRFAARIDNDRDTNEQEAA